ncbi:GH25 family lysozyme [Arthrobacter woluwensis]|uniref:GH25 family lysozyme n=1 Tax=Arthrobacter woluwensis TaxID=156980 RepID=UPI0015E77D8A|nr:GH25 family lysozyme [Arthrobacter woluwensis]
MHHGFQPAAPAHRRRALTRSLTAAAMSTVLLVSVAYTAAAAPTPEPSGPSTAAPAPTQLPQAPSEPLPNGQTAGDPAVARQAVGREGATMRTNGEKKRLLAPPADGPAPKPEALTAEKTAEGSPTSGLSGSATGLSRTVPAAFSTSHWRPTFGVPGQDVSAWQGTVNWASQWSLGSRFAYVKASEGTYYTNANFASQYNGSANQGMVRGAYHFAIPSWSSGADQARYFASHGGGWSGDGRTLPPVLDIEYNPYVGRTDLGYNSGDTCYNLAGAPMVKWITDFGNTMRQLTGRYPVIYTTTDWWKRCTGNSAAFSSYPLWIAAYPSSASNTPGTLPASWQQYSIWQYSDEGPFAGDSNVWNGDLTGLSRFATYGDSTRFTAVGDFNGDKRPDLVGIRPDGTLALLPGNGSGGYGAATVIGRGWNIYQQLIGAGDLNGDGRPDLLGVRPDSSVWFYAGTGAVNSGNQGYAPAVRLPGLQWSSYSRILGGSDLTGDGRPDILALGQDNALYLIPGLSSPSAGSSGFGPARKLAGTNWGAYPLMALSGSFTKSNTPGLIASDATGVLLLFPSLGKIDAAGNAFGAPLRIGNSGWGQFSGLLSTGDSNLDGQPDLLALRPDGSSLFYPGVAGDSDGYATARKIGNGGWTSFAAVTGGFNLNGAGPADTLGIYANGKALLYAGTSSGQLGTGTALSTSFGPVKSAFLGDFSSTGRGDVLTIRPDGTLWFSANNGPANGLPRFATPRQIGSGWNIYQSVQAVRNLSGKGSWDLIGIKPDGTLWLYPGTGNVSFSTPQKIGNSSWQTFTSVLPIDADGDNRTDLYAVRRDGTLWFYQGTGTSPYIAPGRQVGRSGWTAYKALAPTGDLTGDGRADFVGINTNGSLWFYAGTGMPESSLGTGRLIGTLR